MAAVRRRAAAQEDDTPRRKKRKAGGAITVDFTGVEKGGAASEGQHVATIEEVTQETSESGNPMLVIVMKTDEGPKVWHRLSLQPQALWKLRGFLEALGYEVPEEAMEIDPESFVGEQVGLQIEHETYQGRKQARVIDVFPATEVEEEEEEEPGPKKRGSAKAAPAKSAPKRRAAAEEEEEEEEAEEEEEEEPAPPRRKGAAPAPAPRRRRPAQEEEEEEEESADVKVGSKVSFEDEGKTIKGTVTKIDKKAKTAQIETSKGDEWEIELEDLTVL